MLSKLDHILNNMELFELLTLIEADRRLAALHLLWTLRSKVYHTLWYMLVFYLISSCKGMKISFFKSVFIFCFFFTEIAPKCGDVFDIYSSFFYHRVLWHWHGLQRMKRLFYICMYIYIHLYCYNVEEMLLFHKYSCFFW